MLSYCVYDKKNNRQRFPAAKKQKSPKTAKNTFYLFVPFVGKKSLFNYQNTTFKYIFSLLYMETQVTSRRVATGKAIAEKIRLNKQKQKSFTSGESIAEKIRLHLDAAEVEINSAKKLLALN